MNLSLLTTTSTGKKGYADADPVSPGSSHMHAFYGPFCVSPAGRLSPPVLHGDKNISFKGFGSKLSVSSKKRACPWYCLLEMLCLLGQTAAASSCLLIHLLHISSCTFSKLSLSCGKRVFNIKHTPTHACTHTDTHDPNKVSPENANKISHLILYLRNVISPCVPACLSGVCVLPVHRQLGLHLLMLSQRSNLLLLCVAHMWLCLHLLLTLLPQDTQHRKIRVGGDTLLKTYVAISPSDLYPGCHIMLLGEVNRRAPLP